MLTLVTVIYGDNHLYRVELFGSILSILKQRRDPDTRVIVYTDRPLTDFPLPVTQRVITPAEWNEWTRGSDVTHLAKLHLVRETVEQSAGAVVYFDIDTLFLTAPEEIAKKLSAKSALMHANEGAIADHDIWKGLALWLGEGRDVCGHRLAASSVMYNSGIVGVTPDHLEALGESVHIAAALHDIDPVFSLDQFSTGVALGAQASIATCEDEVLHYWGWSRAFIRQGLDRFWRQHEGATPDELAMLFDPHAFTSLPNIHFFDKLLARYRALRWRLNPDGRFACIALESALRHATTDIDTANHWFAVHLDFLDKQQQADTDCAIRLRNALTARYRACESWLNETNAAVLLAAQ